MREGDQQGLRLQNFYAEICKLCKLGRDKKACSLTLMLDNFVYCGNNCRELSSTEPDLVNLGTIQSLLNCNEKQASLPEWKKNQQHGRMAYFYHGKRICMSENISFLTLPTEQPILQPGETLQEEWFKFMYPWKCKTAPQQCIFCQNSGISSVVKFIKNIAEEQALLMNQRHTVTFKSH